jgi:hypothetical protein
VLWAAAVYDSDDNRHLLEYPAKSHSLTGCTFSVVMDNKVSAPADSDIAHLAMLRVVAAHVSRLRSGSSDSDQTADMEQKESDKSSEVKRTFVWEGA